MTVQTEGHTHIQLTDVTFGTQEFDKSNWLESQKVPNLNSLEPIPKIPMAF